MDTASITRNIYSFTDLIRNGAVRIDYRRVMSRCQTVSRARKIITASYDIYDLLDNNCEHFVNLCTRNEKVSHHVSFGLTTTSAQKWLTARVQHQLEEI